jgi:tRNA (guanine-N7-)-methyltransferase
LNDYAYVLKIGGKLYTITDVEDLHKWHVETIDSSPCFRRLSEDEIVLNIY